MSRFRTASKFRHAQGKIASDRNLWYLDVNPSKETNANILAASTKYLAINWQTGAGQVNVLPLGALGKRDGTDAALHGHSSSVLDLQWSPHDSSKLATGADDGTVRIWSIDDQWATGKGGDAPNAVTLSGHKRGVTSIAWNPCASNVIASGSVDGSVRVWDTAAAGAAKLCVEFGDDASVEGIAWNGNGSLLAAIGKDNKLRVVDVRAQSVVQEGAAHTGIKASRVVWLPTHDVLVTSGFTKQRQRELCMWNPKDLSKPMKRHQIDQSTGVLELHYDDDSELLIVAGKGDGSIRMFECSLKTPFLFECPNKLQSDKPQKGVCLLPKLAVAVMDAEVLRVFKALENAVVPISVVVPRKAKRTFSDLEELFPDTRGMTPALSGEEWFGGETKEMSKVSVDPARNKVEAAAPSTVAPPKQEEIVLDTVAPKFIDRSLTDANTGRITASLMEEENKKKAEQEAKATKPYVPSVKTRQAMKLVRSTKFRHISGREFKKEVHYTHYPVLAASSLFRQIHCNEKFFAIPLQGAGGRLGIVELANEGRAPNEVPRFECGSNILDFEFSPFHNDQMTVALESATIKVFKVPEGGLKGAQADTCAELKGHRGKVTHVAHHPTADGLLVSASMDHTVKVWDQEKSKDVLTIAGAHTAGVHNLSYDYTGKELASAAKDKKLRIFDLRSSTEVASALAHQGAKGFMVQWMGQHDRLFTVGFSKSSERECAIWDVRKLDKWLARTGINTGSGAFMPFYDEDLNVAFCASKGDTSIYMYEPADKPHFLTQHSGGEPQLGVWWLPKTVCDVRKVEIRRFLKVTPNGTVVPLELTVPRKRDEFFQDDLYPPCRDSVPAQTAADWLGGADADPVLRSLQPHDMTPLSEAPAEERKGPKYTLQPEVKKKQDASEQLFDLANWRVGMNALSGIKSKEDAALEEQEGVDESEWD